MMHFHLSWNVQLYLVYSSCLMLAFAGLYQLVFRKFTFFTINRYYLLAALIFSLILPFIQLAVPAESTLPLQKQAMLKDFTEDTDGLIREVQKRTFSKAFNRALNSKTSSTNTVGLVYWLVSALFFCRLVLIIFTLAVQKRRGVKRGAFIWIKPLKSYTNSSFFNLLFIDADQLSKPELTQVLMHENVHRVRLHSLDKLLIELVQIFLWFNPLIYYYKRVIASNHEFEVDQVLCKSFNKTEYSNFLLALCSPSSLLVNSFSRHPLRSRIRFIFKKPSSQLGKLSYLTVLPVIFMLFLLFSVQSTEAFQGEISTTLSGKLEHLLTSPSESVETPRKLVSAKDPIISSPEIPAEKSVAAKLSLAGKAKNVTGQPFTVVLDPGHGGADTASSFRQVNEKDLVLEIALILKQKLLKAGFNVLMTRDDDRFVTLQERVKYGGDAYISLHVNISDEKDKEESPNGMEIIVPNKTLSKDSAQLSKSYLLAGSVQSGLCALTYL